MPQRSSCPSINHKGEARFGPAFSRTPGNTPTLGGKPGIKAVGKSAITGSRANVDGVPQLPNPSKTGNTIATAGKQGEPDILGKALKLVNKGLS